MTATLNLTEAKAKFSDVVEKASQGEEIIQMGRLVDWAVVQSYL